MTNFTTTEWFKVRDLGNQIWAIDDHGQDVIYLVCGEERCLLLDTGWGIGNLPALAASLSSLPLIVVNTHNHPDHTFGNGQFPQVMMSEADFNLSTEPGPPSLEERRWIVENILPKPLPADFDMNAWATSVPEVQIVQDGDVFDLGNRSLEVIALPGHSPGSICLLDRKTRGLFVGDSILPWAIWMQLPESTPLHEFHNNLQRIQGFGEAFDHILPAHGDLNALPMPKSLLDDLVTGIASVLTGECVGKPEHTFAGDGLRCDFGTCGVLYNPERL